jgi:hypothetical protein
VRVEVAHDIADDRRGFAERPVPVVAVLLHRVENSTMYRLQPVAHIGQRPRDDDAHGVIEIGAPHLLFDRDGRDVER